MQKPKSASVHSWQADPIVIKHLESVAAVRGDEPIELGFGTFTWGEILKNFFEKGRRFAPGLHEALYLSLLPSAR